jgi:predicted lipoprotein with Yx(FWY)xxD motif
MKKATLILITTALTLFVAGTSFADHHAVKTANKEGVGKHLTDADGMSLYWFVKDSAGKSNCKGGCLEKWPAFYRAAIVPPAGVDASDFGTLTRDDGQKQTTFRGYPLYYFFKDKQAGDTNGQGIKNIWYLIDPAHFPVQ